MRNTETLNKRPNFSFFEGSITSSEDITSCLHKHKVDTIIHLAAQSSVQASLQDSASVTTTNIVGTQVLLECAKTCGVRRVVLMSSYEVYGATKVGPDGHHEDDALSPLNPYGGSKAAAEMLVTAFGHCNPLETIIVRSGNIYGPHQFPDSVCSHFYIIGARLQFSGRDHTQIRHTSP